MRQIAALIGRPWQIPCEPPHTFECMELCVYVRDMLGLDTPTLVDRLQRDMDNRGYLETPDGVWQQLDRPHTGCIARIGASHVGIYLADQRGVLHASEGSGVRLDKVAVLERLWSVDYWELKDG